MGSKRKSISPKLRFEVFKRDGFVCTYCGAHPPKVILEVDHIVPVAAGGKNDMDNLTTSCYDCNRGKMARDLKIIPQSLAEKAALVKEREKQLKAYNAVLEAARLRTEKDIFDIGDELGIVTHKDNVRSIDSRQYHSIKNFLRHMSVEEIIDAIDIARNKMPYGSYKMFKYFCGICWKMIKEENNG